MTGSSNPSFFDTLGLIHLEVVYTHPHNEVITGYGAALDSTLVLKLGVHVEMAANLLNPKL